MNTRHNRNIRFDYTNNAIAEESTEAVIGLYVMDSIGKLGTSKFKMIGRTIFYKLFDALSLQ